MSPAVQGLAGLCCAFGPYSPQRSACTQTGGAGAGRDARRPDAAQARARPVCQQFLSPLGTGTLLHLRECSEATPR